MINQKSLLFTVKQCAQGETVKRVTERLKTLFLLQYDTFNLIYHP
jgi:hypothetical protein